MHNGIDGRVEVRWRLKLQMRMGGVAKAGLSRKNGAMVQGGTHQCIVTIII